MEAEATENRDLLSALWMKELDYILLILATQRHNIDNMIPSHEARIDELAALLRSKDLRSQKCPEQAISSQGSEGQDTYDIAMSLF